MRVRGALHVHSKLSRDGTMTIAELAQWYWRRGYHFLAMGEHAEDLDTAKVQALLDQSSESSNDEFCVIPGIEFAATDLIHILGIGATNLIAKSDPQSVAREIHRQGGVAVLAHPKRMGWECPQEVLLAVDAAEIWNVGYDGKYLPASEAWRGFQRMRQSNPKLLAVASHDLHRTASFYAVAIEMVVASLSRNAILSNLQQGRYDIRSPLFRCDAKAQISKVKVASLRFLSQYLHAVRKARAVLLRPLAR